MAGSVDGSRSPDESTPSPEFVKEQMLNNLEFSFDPHVRNFLERIIENGALEVSYYTADDTNRSFTLKKTTDSPDVVRLAYPILFGISEIPIEVRLPETVHYQISPGICAMIKAEGADTPFECTVHVPVLGERKVSMKVISMENDETDKRVHNLMLEHGEKVYVAPTHKLDEIVSK